MTPPLFASVRELSQRIDHSVLQLGATARDVEEGAKLARARDVRALVVAPSMVRVAARGLQGSSVKVAAVVGFPSGASTSACKQFEALECEKHGAVELDIVIHTGALRAGDHRYVEREIADVMKVTPECVHKVIVEAGLLTADEVLGAVRICNRLSPRFVKTCTGMGPRGVTVADVELIRSELARGMMIKAAGGIRTLAAAEALVRAGAAVLGTSNSAAILDELEESLRAQGM